MNSTKIVLLARSNGGPEFIKKQVEVLKRFARENQMSVVDIVRLPYCSANDERVDGTLATFSEKGNGRNANAIVVADLSRLSRRGPHALMSIIWKLGAMGIRV